MFFFSHAKFISFSRSNLVLGGLGWVFELKKYPQDFQSEWLRTGGKGREGFILEKVSPRRERSHKSVDVIKLLMMTR